MDLDFGTIVWKGNCCKQINMVDSINLKIAYEHKFSAMMAQMLNPIALRMAKTLWSFGHSECNRVKIWIHYQKNVELAQICPNNPYEHLFAM